MGTFVKRLADPMNLIFKEEVKAPVVNAPAEMPDYSDPKVAAAKRKAAAASSSGRSSTLLSGSGGSDFSAGTLG